MKTWLFFAAVCVIEICSTGCQYDNGGVNVSGMPAAGGTGGTADPERPPPGGSASGGSGTGGTAGSGGSVGVSSVPPTPVKMDAAPAPAADAAAPAPLPPDAAPDSTPPPLPPDAAPSADPDPFCPATPDLAVCLRFESKLLDESPNQLMVGGSARYAPGVSGQALEPSPNSRVAIPESAALDSGAITIEAWVNARELGRRMDIVQNAGQYTMVVLGSGSVMCSGRGGYALRSNTVTPGRWIHLACIFEATSHQSVARRADGAATSGGAGRHRIHTGGAHRLGGGERHATSTAASTACASGGSPGRPTRLGDLAACAERYRRTRVPRDEKSGILD